METGKIIDAHVHGVSILFFEELMKPPANCLDAKCISSILNLMDRHHIDQAVGVIAQGISILPLENELTLKIARAIPEKMPAVMVGFSQPQDDPFNYGSRQAAEEIESYMKNPSVKGVGEFALEAVCGMVEWPDAWAKLRPIFDVLAAHQAPILFHTGPAPFFPKHGGKTRPASPRSLWFANPIFIDDIASEYPEVPIIIGHSGVQSFFYYGAFADMALMVAARHKNVYLETSSVPYEVLEKAVLDPAIGPEKLIFGSDSPAFYGYYARQKDYYPSYGKEGIPEYVPDHYKYELEFIDRLPVYDRQRTMILGGNIARLLASKKE